MLVHRIQQLFHRAAVYVNELAELHQSTKDHMEEMANKQYKAECSAASSFANVVIGRISDGDKIDGKLQFEVMHTFLCMIKFQPAESAT